MYLARHLSIDYFTVHARLKIRALCVFWKFRGNETVPERTFIKSTRLAAAQSTRLLCTCMRAYVSMVKLARHAFVCTSDIRSHCSTGARIYVELKGTLLFSQFRYTLLNFAWIRTEIILFIVWNDVRLTVYTNIKKCKVCEVVKNY